MTRSDSSPPADSETGRTLGVIPARLASSRLPRKPLHPLLGRPLLAWVWDRARAMPALDQVVIAVDSEELRAACEAFGGRAILTDPAHPSGTDRVAEVAMRPEFEGYDVIVNVQGDEPLMDPAHVEATVELVRSGWDVGTCATAITDREELLDPSVVKVVQGDHGGALYFSRAPIPAVREAGDQGPDPASMEHGTFLRHVGLYTYRRAALARWVALPEGDLERIERLEQLRPLAAGIGIGVTVVESAAPGVDTPEDAAAMELLLREYTSDPTATRA